MPTISGYVFAAYFLKSLVLCKSFRISPSQTIELICRIHKVGGDHRCCLSFTQELNGKCCAIENLCLHDIFLTVYFFYFYTRDTFLCFPSIRLAFSSAPQASGETAWLWTAVSLHLSSVWARVLGGKTPSHGNGCWGPHHPHPSNCRGHSPTGHPYSAGQSPSYCGGQKGQPSFLCVCDCIEFIHLYWAVKKNPHVSRNWAGKNGRIQV